MVEQSYALLDTGASACYVAPLVAKDFLRTGVNEQTVETASGPRNRDPKLINAKGYHSG